MQTMKKYAKYKPSGVEWIGEIPQHWEVANVGRLNNLGRGRVISALEIGANGGEYPVFSSQTENSGIMGYLNTYDFEGEYVTWTTDGANAGTVFYREGKFNCTNVCGTVQPKNWNLIDLKFLPYFLNLGTRFSVRLDINPKLMNNMMAKIPLIVPPKSEQTAIAVYLDRKTAQIDKLIANKQKLIELLKEERAAVINHAVTKGIDPNVKLKFSGLDWLGDIPEHWEVKKLKYLAKIFRGKFTHRPRNDEKLYGGKYPFIQTGEVAKAGKYLNSFPQTLNENGLKVTTLFPKGTLLMTIAANIGEVAILGIDACFPDSIVGFYPDDVINKEYLFYKLKSLKEVFICTSVLNTQLNLNVDRVSTISITVPTPEEQLQIVQFIETQTQRIDNTISQIEKEIELLQEYRTALISEVVTGKIKVI
jgi:type I restriction enzyme, S subunit